MKKLALSDLYKIGITAKHKKRPEDDNVSFNKAEASL